MSVRAVISTLPYKLKYDVEEYAYKQYVTRCLRILTENSAIVSQGQGKYIAKEYDDIINPKPEKVIEKGDAKKSICAKLR
jgi:hypothetical protein